MTMMTFDSTILDVLTALRTVFNTSAHVTAELHKTPLSQVAGRDSLDKQQPSYYF